MKIGDSVGSGVIIIGCGVEFELVVEGKIGYVDDRIFGKGVKDEVDVRVDGSVDWGFFLGVGIGVGRYFLDGVNVFLVA